MNISFKNIFDALSFREKCPLCFKRNKISLISISDELAGPNRLDLYSAINNNLLIIPGIKINILTNELFKSHETEYSKIIINSRCKKLHYFHSISLEIYNNVISIIKVDNEAFSIYNKSKYYRIENNYKDADSTLNINIMGNSKTYNVPMIQVDKKKKVLRQIEKILLLA